ncbi:uncharacterized protein [Arachis hypogaea]|uniref:uncharacterized protein n=1 Tax=Arachis hypogaea TaxID=3818 RepID=UPI0007AF0A95
MRLSVGPGNASSNELNQFSEWILKFGDGKIGISMGGVDKVEIPDDILIRDWIDPIKAICKATYPKLFGPLESHHGLHDRAILAQTLQHVDEINNYMMTLNSAKSQKFFSSDKACPTEGNNELLASVHIPEFLNTIRCSGVSNHELTLKVGTPIMLLRNIDHTVGLCNGTHLVVTKLGKHIIETRNIS